MASNETMIISQVIKSLEEEGYPFTKTMIQNYIRIGLLPPPVNKRYYTNHHLMLLSLIYRLKDVFSLDEIKKIFITELNQGDVLVRGNTETKRLYQAYEKFQLKALDDLTLMPRPDETDALMVALELMAKITTMKQVLDEIIKGH